METRVGEWETNQEDSRDRDSSTTIKSVSHIGSVYPHEIGFHEFADHVLNLTHLPEFPI